MAFGRTASHRFRVAVPVRVQRCAFDEGESLVRDASSPSGRSLWKQRKVAVPLLAAMTKPDFSANKPKTQEQAAQANAEPTGKSVADQNEVKKNSKAEVRMLVVFPICCLIDVSVIHTES